MKRERRLRKGGPFDRVFREGIATSGPFFVVRVAKNGGARTRWGFAVGKKVAKRATVRNRARRRLREAAAQVCVREGHDIVVIARERALGARFGELQGALRRQLAKAGLVSAGKEGEP